MRLRKRTSKLAPAGNTASGLAVCGLAMLGLACAVLQQQTPTPDFSAPEPGEALPGGATTNRERLGRDAFSQPAPNLSFEERAEFFIGNGIFRRSWIGAPASTRSADGLGPLYNARSCQRCHLKDGRGHPPASLDDSAVSMLVRLSIPEQPGSRAASPTPYPGDDPEPVYGGQFQDQAVPSHAREGRIEIRYADVPVQLAGGERIVLRRPTLRLVALGYGPLHPDTMMSARVAPPMIGLGLLEAVAEDDIVAAADPDDRDGDGISGKANRVWSKAQKRMSLGRFGWKAGQPSLAEQSSGAMAGDIGVSSPLAPAAWGDCSAAQASCRAGPHGIEAGDANALEASAEVMDRLFFYTKTIAVPARRGADRADVLKGKSLFYGAGCTGCHRPKLVTRHDVEPAALADQQIWPYTDLLLHDMGEGLADQRPEWEANGREWRTPPLWAIGLTETVSGHSFFLHDGRARNLSEAILWHGGEAKAARDAFAAMESKDRHALLSFLESL